jgi:hypothetical protein
MVAAAGASGIRSWLQTRNFSALTPVRLRRITVALFVLALAVSSIRLSGSTAHISGKQHRSASVAGVR